MTLQDIPVAFNYGNIPVARINIYSKELVALLIDGEKLGLSAEIRREPGMDPVILGLDIIGIPAIEEPAKYAWVVREHRDKNEGKMGMGDVYICASEKEAFNANRSVDGVMGNPPQYGGEIWKITLGKYPIEQELVFGNRHSESHRGMSTWGWLDYRDAPDKNDPEYVQYLELRKKFDPMAVDR